MHFNFPNNKLIYACIYEKPYCLLWTNGKQDFVIDKFSSLKRAFSINFSGPCNSKCIIILFI